MATGVRTGFSGIGFSGLGAKNLGVWRRRGAARSGCWKNLGWTETTGGRMTHSWSPDPRRGKCSSPRWDQNVSCAAVAEVSVTVFWYISQDRTATPVNLAHSGSPGASWWGRQGLQGYSVLNRRLSPCAASTTMSCRGDLSAVRRAVRTAPHTSGGPSPLRYPMADWTISWRMAYTKCSLPNPPLRVGFTYPWRIVPAGKREASLGLWRYHQIFWCNFLSWAVERGCAMRW